MLRRQVNMSKIATGIVVFRRFLYNFNRMLSPETVYRGIKLLDMSRTQRVLHLCGISVYLPCLLGRYYSLNKNYSNTDLTPFPWSKIARKKFSELRILPTRIQIGDLARPQKHPQNLPQRFQKI